MTWPPAFAAWADTFDELALALRGARTGGLELPALVRCPPPAITPLPGPVECPEPITPIFQEV